MKRHLLLITLGPVQEFIAQARRTRDLWYGSHLLSELSRAAARALVDAGAELVFPALKKEDPELAPCPAPLRTSGAPPRNVSNKLLAEVLDGVDPEDVARKVRKAVMQFWRDDIAERVRHECSPLLAGNIDGVWDEQINTFVEFAASWAQIDDYAATRRKLEQAIAARKNLRDFVPWQQQRGDVEKSSLDGGRETVLATQRDPKLARTYRIAKNEQLDAVGLVKRAGGEPDQFVPVVNVAFASWIDFAAHHASAPLTTLLEECQKIGLSKVRRPDLPCARQFGFDASVLLRSRWKPVFEEQGLHGDPEEWGGKHVVPLLDALSEPCRYVACLVADGDRMGRTIDALVSPGEHRKLSGSLNIFAAEARKIVEQKHFGSLVYAGGDDILAFVPLPQALSCADALRRSFASHMANAARQIPNAAGPTLSVGIGVGHVMESMGDLLSLGREAERLAKGDRLGEVSRNAVAIVVEKRSGGKPSWRARWDEWKGDPVGRLRTDAAVLEQQLSTRKVYEISRALNLLPKPSDAIEPEWTRILALEVRRSLSRVHAGESAVEPDKVGLSLTEAPGYEALRREVSSWVDRMLVARTFASAEPQLRRRVQEGVA